MTRTDDAAFLADFGSMSSIGATSGGGVDRQAATMADGQTRSWFRGTLEARGFGVHYDEVGNQFGVLELAPGAPYLAIGSHLDSQPNAGRFDGAYGVLAAMYAALRIAQQYATNSIKPTLNLAVVNWFNEEGCRFKPSMMGSSVITGKLPAEEALATTDRTGTTVRAALESIETVGNYRLDLAGYIELHIEQGRELQDAGLAIGLVSSTWAANKYELVVHGEQAHTGATAIEDRHDALLGASSIVVAAREIAERFSDEEVAVITSCGEFTVRPNSPVVVASQVSMLVDLRSSDANRLADADAELQHQITAIEERSKVRIERRTAHTWSAKSYDERGLALAAASAKSLGLPYDTVRTRAGHDSTNLNDVVPTIMLFVPSIDGISHNEKELTSDQDMLAGVTLLTEVARRALEGELVKPSQAPQTPT